jgi:hypothetical protein
VLPFGEQYVLHDAVDLGMDADREGGLHGAETSGVDRQVLPACRRDAHRHGGAARPARATRRFGRLLPIPVETTAGGGDEHDADQQLAAP